MAHARPLAGHLRLRSVVLVALLLAGGCGRPDVGGAGRLVRNAADAPDHLVVEGTPRQMGVWQGRLLRARIRAVHAAAQDRAFGAGEGARALREACALYVDQTLRRLPEALRQELEGIAQGADVDPEGLLLTAVLRDGLRWHGAARPLGGTLALSSHGPEIRMRPTGPDVAGLSESWLLVERRPARGRATVCWTWPGSLGGLAVVREGGLGALATEVPRPLPEQRLGDLPFTMRLRRAVETGADVRDVLQRLDQTTGHRVAILDARAGTLLLGLAGLVSTESVDLSSIPFLTHGIEREPGPIVLPGMSFVYPTDVAVAFEEAGYVTGADDAWIAVRGRGGHAELFFQPGRGGSPDRPRTGVAVVPRDGP